MMNYQHPELGLVDVYPVGVLHALQVAARSLTVAGIPRDQRISRARKAIRGEARHLRRHLADRDWRALRNSFNGYLAEPYTIPEHMTRCGHAWTKRRALADLTRHHRATLKETR